MMPALFPSLIGEAFLAAGMLCVVAAILLKKFLKKRRRALEQAIENRNWLFFEP